MIELTLNALFQPKFKAGFELVATKLIKICPKYIEKIKIDQKFKERLNLCQKILKKSKYIYIFD